MAATTYTYSVSQDTPDGRADAGRLVQGIQESTIVIALDHIDIGISGADNLDIIFKDALSAGDKTTLDGIVGTTSGDPLPTQPENFDADGNLRVVAEPLSGTEVYFFSPNVCDMTTWYEGAGSVTEEALSDSGDLTTWDSVHTFWIDLCHGKVMDENKITGGDPTYLETIETSPDGSVWTPKTRNTWGTTDGDYDIDYDSGKVVFNSALAEGTQVRAKYRYATTFRFTVTPDTGKRLKVNYVEVQFSRDIQITGSSIFQIRVYNPYDPAWNPPTNMPKTVYAQRNYKTLQDFYTESTGPYPVQPAQGLYVVEEITGESNIQAKVQDGYDIKGSYYDSATGEWVALMQGIDPTADRTIRQDLVTIPFKYGTYRNLQSSLGAEILVTLENGVFGGEWATFTFYCMSETES